MTRRFALHFAFATNMSKITSDSEVRKWKPEGLDLSAGPVPVFPIIYIIYRDQRIAAPSQALLCEPRSTADLRRIVLERRCHLISLTCA